MDEHGNAWFTEFFADKLGEIKTNGSLSEWKLTNTSFSEPAGIAIENSTVWFTLSETRWVGSFSEGKISLYDLSKLTVSSLVGISLDSAGNIWLTQHGSSLISEFNPSTHYFRTMSTSIPPLGESLPYFVQIDPQGNVWFDEHYGNAIGKFEPLENSMIEYEIPTQVPSVENLSGALSLALSRQGVPWFTEAYASKIGVVNASAPIGLSIRVGPFSASQDVADKGDDSSFISNVSITSTADNQIALTAASGNLSSMLEFRFSPSKGLGSFNSTLTVDDAGSPPGIYFLTVSSVTKWVVVSQVIELKIP